MHAVSPSNSSDPARGGTLTSFDLAFCRIVGAGLVLVTLGILFGVRAALPVATKTIAAHAGSTGARG
ncbi:MAG TPA: hypothetical protein VIK56_03855 [Rhodoferax sp.]